MVVRRETRDFIRDRIRQEVATMLRGMESEWLDHTTKTLIENKDRIKALDERVKQIEKKTAE